MLMAVEQTARLAVCSILEREFDDVSICKWIQTDARNPKKSSSLERGFDGCIVCEWVQTAVHTAVKTRKIVDFF